MSALRRVIPVLAIPVNIALLVWMVIGRGLFVPFGWMMIFGVLASPVLAIFLVISTVMMLRPRGRELTSLQAWAQIVVWLAMFGFGLACLDGGDSGGTASVLTKLAPGWPTMETVSGVLMWACCLVGFVAWIVLVASLGTRPVVPPPPPPYPYPYPGTHPPR